MATTAVTPEVIAIPVGEIKSFGPYGPQYEVTGHAPSENGEARVFITLVRTGERTTYGYEAMLSDPKAY